MITKLPATFLQRFSTKKIEKMWKNRKKSSNNARSNEKLHNSKEQSKHERVADDLGGWARVWATNESVLRIARAGHAYLEYGKLLEGRYEPSDFLIRRPRLGRCDRTVGSGWNQLKNIFNGEHAEVVDEPGECRENRSCVPNDRNGLVDGSGGDGDNIVISSWAIGLCRVNAVQDSYDSRGNWRQNRKKRCTGPIVECMNQTFFYFLFCCNKLGWTPYLIFWFILFFVNFFYFNYS